MRGWRYHDTSFNEEDTKPSNTEDKENIYLTPEEAEQALKERNYV